MGLVVAPHLLAFSSVDNCLPIEYEMAAGKERTNLRRPDSGVIWSDGRVKRDEMAAISLGIPRYDELSKFLEAELEMAEMGARGEAAPNKLGFP